MYIGNTVQNQGFTPQVDFFSGNASTTAFTLSRPVASVYQMVVVVANVIQNPGSAYTVSSNTITFSSAPPTGTNNIWVEYTSLITQVIAPSPGTVGTSQLQSNLTLGGTTTASTITSAASTNLSLQTNGGTTALTLDTSQNATFAGKVASASSLQLATNGTTTAITVDTSQNVGIGVTPSAWASNAKVLQLGPTSSFVNSGAGDTSIGENRYFNGTNNIYLSNTFATLYQQTTGQHRWFNAPSSTGVITFTQAMLLDASSNLTIAGSTATKASGTTWANPSDTRLKNNQALYTKGLTELNQIKVKTWVYNGLGGSLNGQTGIGVIADEAMIVLPDTVDTYSAKLNPTDSEETDIKRFNASEVIWLLVTSLQELDAKFESYKATHP